MKKQQYLYLIMALCLLSGCATQPLTIEEKARISWIYIDWKIESIHYQKYGLTIFNNEEKESLQLDLVQKGKDFLASTLIDLGYELSSTVENADTILLVEPIYSPSPYGRKVFGIGIAAESLPGVSPRAIVQCNIIFRLIDVRSDDWISTHVSEGQTYKQMEEIKGNWDDLADKDRVMLYKAIEELFLNEISNVISIWSL